MSSAETPDDDKPPPFDFDQWLIEVATAMAVIAMALMLVVHFYHQR